MQQKLSIRDLALISTGAALLAVCAWITLPLPAPLVPFTLQTFGVCLLSALLGTRRGVSAVAVYLLLGGVGIPVFSGFRGGAEALLGTTGGYLLGFLFTALIVGLAADRFGRRPKTLIPAMVLGLAVCYAFGTAWFVTVYARTRGPIGVLGALSMCVFPYLIPDALKIAVAVILAGRLEKYVRGGIAA
ncbi:MAG: biotin transporter BioY [Oscillospiraceae bacterium]|nr:biotin transporter BioY [Oscillospiraceae bacterium]